LMIPFHGSWTPGLLELLTLFSTAQKKASKAQYFHY
jgi:hypothetical protein